MFQNRVLLYFLTTNCVFWFLDICVTITFFLIFFNYYLCCLLLIFVIFYYWYYFVVADDDDVNLMMFLLIIFLDDVFLDTYIFVIVFAAAAAADGICCWVSWCYWYCFSDYDFRYFWYYWCHFVVTDDGDDWPSILLSSRSAITTGIYNIIY